MDGPPAEGGEKLDTTTVEVYLLFHYYTMPIINPEGKKVSDKITYTRENIEESTKRLGITRDLAKEILSTVNVIDATKDDYWIDRFFPEFEGLLPFATDRAAVVKRQILMAADHKITEDEMKKLDEIIEEYTEHTSDSPSK